MNSNGVIAGEERPSFHWTGMQHTETRKNEALWRMDRPVPMLYHVDMAWHHMIPWEALAKGWTGLVQGGQWDVLEAWLRMIGDTSADVHVAQMKNSQLPAEVAEELTGRLCWARWNLVEGPEGRFRTDDPGSDDMDLFASAMVSPSLRSRCYQLQPIYNRIRHWNAGTVATAADGAVLRSALQKLQGSSNSSIAMFDPKVWVVVASGKFDGNGQAVNNQHPRWKKAK